MLGSRRAVQADDVDRQSLERRQHRADVGPEEHPPRRVERHLDLERDSPPALTEASLDPDDRRLDLEHVLARLEEQQVAPTLDERLCLLGEDLRELAKGDRAERRIVGGGEHARRAHRASDEPRPLGRRELVGGRAREAGGGEVDLVDAIGHAVLA